MTETQRTRPATLPLFAIAAAIALVHLLTNGRYGFHRDELQFLTDARHLDWGFVAYPPVTPFLERLSLDLFGLSLVGLRLFSVLAQSTGIFVTGLIAREFGARRLAQIAAALCVALSPLPLFEGTEFQYTSFDFLWWVLIAYFLASLVNSDDGRWWIAIGTAVGLGLETKYSILFFIAGILGGMLLTPARRFFATRWFWFGAALALLIVLPNLLWQVKHHFIYRDFFAHIHARDVGEGRTNGFLIDQFYICTNPATVPIWIAGLIAFFRRPRFRLFAWMYAIPLALFVFDKGRGYYLAAAYPMLLAMGAATAERWLPTLRHPWRNAAQAGFFTALGVAGALFMAILIPLAPAGQLKAFALKNNGDLREEVGWDDLLQQLAAIRDSLPAGQSQSFGIVAGNYGEAGAIDILGPAYGLPSPINTTNSGWLRGYPTPQPTTLIVLGFGHHGADRAFSNCRVIGHEFNSLGVDNEESHYEIFLCGPPRLPWPDFWKQYQNFG